MSFKTLILAICMSISISNSFAAPNDHDEYDLRQSSGAYKLALAAINQKDYPEAINHLDGLVVEQPNHADAYNLLGFSHRKMKNYQTAEHYYNKALAIEPKHKGALEYLGELYVETQRLEKARSQLSKLDQACWFGCKEYDLLKTKIETAEQQ